MSGESESPPPQNPTPSPVTSKRPQPVSWTQQETVHLIQAYQDKWYSLKRGPLKADQWEEVALNLALLSGSLHPPKSALQCRHKMEKLRKRFREEKRRLSSSPSPSSSFFWPYFYLMDALERGPFPVSSRPLLDSPVPAALPLANPHNYQYAPAPFGFDNAGGYVHSDNVNYTNYVVEEEEEEVEEEEEEEMAAEDRYFDGSYRSKSRSINYIIKKPAVSGGGKRKREEGAGLRELAEEIRGMAERIVGVEREKLEMVKEMERWKMEMESKRMEMILGSQRKIIGLINDVFHGHQQQRQLKVEDGF